MSDGTFDIRIDNEIFKQLKALEAQFQQLNGKVTSIEKGTKNSFSSISAHIKSISLTNLTTQLQNVSTAFTELNAPGMKYSTSMAEVSAITGVTGKQLELLGRKARESAKEFGGSASDSLESYKTILSRLGPDIAKDQVALSEMERNVRTLSKTMGGDTTASVDALTTAMLQYGVDLSNPAVAQKEMARMMNVMAAGAQAGAAEVPQISAALKVSGVAAKQANVSFEETNAALQALATGGKEGSEAGVALRNVLGKMAGEDVIPKEAADKLRRLGVDMAVVSNTSLPFSARLKELKKAQGDATIMAQVFGTENAAAANILLDTVSAQEKLTKEITGTNSAMEQAAIIMDSPAERLSRMKASIEDVKLGFFEATGGVTAYLEPVAQLATTFSSFLPILNGVGKGVQWLGKTKLVSAAGTKIATAAQWLWNAALTANPIGLIIAGVATLTAGVYALSKVINTGTATERVSAEVKQRVLDKTIDQRVEVTNLFYALKKADKGSNEYKETLKKIDQIQPGIVDKYNLQAGALDNISRAERELTANIMKRAEAEARAEILKEKTKELLQTKQDGPSTMQQVAGLFGGPMTTTYLHGKKQKDLQDDIDLLASQVAKDQRGSTVVGKSKDMKSASASSSGASIPSVTASQTGRADKSYQGAGGEVKTINVRIDTLIKEFTISTSNLSESAASVRDKITEAIVGAVRDTEVAL